MTAPTIVQSNFVNNGTSHGSNVAPSLSGVTAGNYLLAIIGFASSGGTNGLTFAAPADSAGQTWPAAIASQATANAPGACGAQAFGLANANAGTHTVTFNNASNSCYAFAGLVEIAGVSSLDQAVAIATTNRTSTSLEPSTGTLAAAAELAIGFMTMVDGTSTEANEGITDPPSGWTSLYVNQDSITSEPGEVASLTTSSTTALSPVWSWTNGSSAAAVIVTFKASTPGAALAGAGSDVSSAGAGFTETLAAWNVGTVDLPQLQRRIFSDDGHAKALAGGNLCQLHEIFPVTLGSGTLTIEDQNGVTVFSETTGNMVAGSVISVGATGTGVLTVTSFPSGGEYGISWMNDG